MEIMEEKTVCFEQKVVRNEMLDIAKGIGIILVVLGHMPSFMPKPIIAWIYSFHMPLYFFISGYFAKPESVVNIRGG